MPGKSRNSIIWNIAVAIGSVIIGALTVGLVEKIGSGIYPPPQLPAGDLAAEELKVFLKNYLQNAPAGALLFVTLSHGIGVAVATVIGCVFGRGTKMPGLIAGSVLWGSTVLNLFSVPHPAWFMFLDMIVVVLAVLIPFLTFKK